MGAAEFRDEIRRLRTSQRMSRTALAQRSGVSSALIEKLETRTPPPRPKRTTVTDLAHALGWKPDEALRMVGYDPLSPDERDTLDKVSDPRAILDRIWPHLTPSQQEAVAQLGWSIVHPGAAGQSDVDDVVVIQEVTPGSGATQPRLRSVDDDAEN